MDELSWRPRAGKWIELQEHTVGPSEPGKCYRASGLARQERLLGNKESVLRKQ